MRNLRAKIRHERSVTSVQTENYLTPKSGTAHCEQETAAEETETGAEMETAEQTQYILNAVQTEAAECQKIRAYRA